MNSNKELSKHTPGRPQWNIHTHMKAWIQTPTRTLSRHTYIHVSLTLWANANKHRHTHTHTLKQSGVHVQRAATVHGSSLWSQGLSQVQMKGRVGTLEELNNTVGHLAWQRDQCLFDWEREKESKRERERGGGGVGACRRRVNHLFHFIDMQVKHTGVRLGSSSTLQNTNSCMRRPTCTHRNNCVHPNTHRHKCTLFFSTTSAAAQNTPVHWPALQLNFTLKPSTQPQLCSESQNIVIAHNKS